MMTPLTPPLAADTASADTTSYDACHGGGQDTGGELGRRRCGRRRREMDLHVSDQQVPTINECKSYYYFTTTS